MSCVSVRSHSRLVGFPFLFKVAWGTPDSCIIGEYPTNMDSCCGCSYILLLEDLINASIRMLPWDTTSWHQAVSSGANPKQNGSVSKRIPTSWVKAALVGDD